MGRSEERGARRAKAERKSAKAKDFPADAIASAIALQFPNILGQRCLVGFR